MVSDQWRELTAEDKEKWEEMAREDKVRYHQQKDAYAGPWKVPADMKKPKDPTAPKKPTPAYFSFSNERRQSVKKDNPAASNGEISKILSKMWKDADDETRAEYVEKEKMERDEYNILVEKWKKERKESGRDNWWEFEQPPEGDGRKRQKLDLLANTAGTQQDTGPCPEGLMHQGTGGLAFPSSLQDQLSALSSQQGNGSFLASLLPGLAGQSSFASNPYGSNMQGLNQQQLGTAGGGLSLGGLFGTSSTGSGFQNNSIQMNQSSLLASLFGGNSVQQQHQQQQQQQQQLSHAHGMNELLLNSLLSGGVQQPQNMQSVQSLLLQQGFPGSSFLQQQNDQGISNAAIAAFLNQQQQQQQMPPPNQSQPDQLAILQSLLQQQCGGNNPAFQQRHQQQQSFHPPSSNNNNHNSALEEALARFVSGNVGGNGSYS